jgi:phosphoesterase RecJ-like protein
MVNARIDWTPVLDLIERGSRFLILTHVHPDGDALGSQLGLRRFLESLGKEVRTTGCGAVPLKYRFLDRNELSVCNQSVPDALDAVFLLDAGEWIRLGCATCRAREAPATKIYIDHHPLRPGVRADHLIVEPRFSSTAEMILDLILSSGRPLTPEIAEPLYVGIVTDTGGFSYGNSTGSAHRAAALLVEQGLDVRRITNFIYHQSTLSRLHLIGVALQRLAHSDAGVAWTFVTYEEMTTFDVGTDEMEGFIDIVRTLRETEIFIVFWQTASDQVKASIRSRGRVAINLMAENLGGGGHPYAAGFTSRDGIEIVVERTVAAAERLLMEQAASPAPAL